MAPLGGCNLSNPVDETWQSLREAVLAHPRISGARFDHEIKRVDLMTEKTVVGPRRRISAFVHVDDDGARVVIAGAGKRGVSHQVASELLADVSDRLAANTAAPEDASPSSPPSAAISIDLSEQPPHVSRTDRGPRTPPAPPPPPSPWQSPGPPAAPRRPPAAPPLASPPQEYEFPADDALSELARGNDWL